MLAEEQAREKWCPMARYADMSVGAANRWPQETPTPHALNPVPCRCIASDCMMWRWELVRAGQSFVDGSKRGQRGWCGLAGKPEAP